MSTLDVPGHKPENRDKLAMGSWAEHEDGSLVHVESVEGGRVVFCMFDVPHDAEYRTAMDEVGFKEQFSWPNTHGEKWTWHDKTPFPWERVMKHFPPGTKFTSAEAQFSAAERVARSLGIRAQQIVRDREELRPSQAATVGDIMRRLHDALNDLERAVTR